MKRMRLLIIALLLLGPLLPVEGAASIRLTAEQTKNLLLAQSIGASTDRSYTLMAIVFQESSARSGIVTDLHLDKQSYGLTGIRISSIRWLAIRRPSLRAEINAMSDDEIARRLVTDERWHLTMAEHLFRLLEKSTGSWRRAIVAWNWGVTRVRHSTNRRLPKDYLNRIRRHVIAFKADFPKKRPA